jgi:asparagine synthase (glutamine-hydrolysing)
MCGICGIHSTVGPPDRQLLVRMIDRLHHRGPDGSGLYRDALVGLGHTRLAIIDTAGGGQPLANEDDTVWVSFNGEIFNYIELRAELIGRGHRFRTLSDTEVIVHAYEQWGVDCFTRFNGQWAVALWDRTTERLVLARDRMGVRPLYVARRPGRTLFASQVSALFADPGLRRELDPIGLAETATFWSAVAPRTVFAGVRQVEPGTCMIIDGDRVRVHRYWATDFPASGSEPSQDLGANAARLRELVVEAVRLRFLRSDVPVGAYLSGGLDSAITAAAIARFTDAPLRTFSVRFADAEFDEGHHQEIMSKVLGTEHTSIMVDAADIADAFPDVVRHAETPLLRSAPAPMFLLSKLVRECGFKVVVTGEGADEVLGGYDIFRESALRTFLARDPGSSLRSRSVELLYPWLARNPGRAPAYARQFFGQDLQDGDPAQSHRPRWNSTRALLGLFAPPWRDRMRGDVAGALVARMPAEQVGWNPLSRAQWLEMTTLLPGYILSSQGDRMLMANSVEGRFPFLDPNVIRFANALPARHKLFGMDEKHLLKRAFADLVPEDIRNRPKQPYRAPDAACFFGPTAPDWVRDLLSPGFVARRGIFDPRAVGGLAAKADRSRGVGMSNTDNMRALLVISTMLLHEQLVVRGGAAWDITSPRHPDQVIDLVPTS